MIAFFIFLLLEWFAPAVAPEPLRRDVPVGASTLADKRVRGTPPWWRL